MTSRTAAAFALAAATAATAQPQPPPTVIGNPPAGSRGAPPQPLPPEADKRIDRAAIKKQGRYQLDFDKVDIDKLIQTMSDMTGKLFILPENIRGKITIIGPQRSKEGVTVDEAYAAFLAALDANGLCLYPTGRYLKLTDKRSCKQTNVPTLLDDKTPYTLNEQLVTRLFRLQYVEPEPIRAVVQQLVSKDGDTISFPPDILIINDIGLNMHRLERLIEKLDQPGGQSEVRIIKLKFAGAQEMADKLRQIFEEKARRPGQRPGTSLTVPPHLQQMPGMPPHTAPPAPGSPREGGEPGAATISQIIPDERTQQLVIIASPSAFKQIEDVLARLDIPVPGEGTVHVYYLKNSSAEDLAQTLASLTQGIQRGPRPPPPGPGQPRQPGTVADLFSGEVKVTADKSTNALVIIASDADYRSLLSVIAKLDRPRRQVFVEAVIMEVNLDSGLKFNIGLHGGGTAKLPDSSQPSSVIAGASAPGAANSLGGILGALDLLKLGGFIAGMQGPLVPGVPAGVPPLPAFGILLQAIQTSSDVNVISTPHILTSDNEDAEISVGSNVPFQAGIAPGGLGAFPGLAGTPGASSAAAALPLLSGLIAPIQRQNVELKLKLKPQINESDFIRLTIEEQTEEIASEHPQLGPTTAKRSAKTVIVAKDQHTVVIGGLIQERYRNSVSKLPILGDIPLIGWLFRSTTRDKSKTNLLLFLTPYIIRDQSDFRRIFERKLRERQDFVEQFYGRQPGVEVAIDYTRKAGPVSKMLRALQQEDQKIENGGPGFGGEKAIVPRPPSPGPAPDEAIRVIAPREAPPPAPPEFSPPPPEAGPPPP